MVLSIIVFLIKKVDLRILISIGAGFEKGIYSLGLEGVGT